MSAKTVTVTAPIAYRAFQTPNFASLAKGTDDSLPLRELPPQVLDALAKQWLEELYQKAGQTILWTMK